MNYGAQPGAELTSQRSQPVLATLLPNVCRALGDPRVAPSPLTRLCLPSVDAPVGGQCDEPLAQQGVQHLLIACVAILEAIQSDVP